MQVCRNLDQPAFQRITQQLCMLQPEIQDGLHTEYRTECHICV